MNWHILEAVDIAFVLLAGGALILVLLLRKAGDETARRMW